MLRTDRRDRRRRRKSDTFDAENAARVVLNGQAWAVPKNADSTVETIRLDKVAKDVAVKARTAVMISPKSVLITAPAGGVDSRGSVPASPPTQAYLDSRTTEGKTKAEIDIVAEMPIVVGDGSLPSPRSPSCPASPESRPRPG